MRPARSPSVAPVLRSMPRGAPSAPSSPCCLALPAAGRERLAELDLDEDFTSDLTRRAAAWVRDRDDDAAPPRDDAELTALLAELAVTAAGSPPSPAALEADAIQLDLLRLERRIAAARAQAAGTVAPLVAEREQLRRRYDAALDRAMAESQPVAPLEGPAARVDGALRRSACGRCRVSDRSGIRLPPSGHPCSTATLPGHGRPSSSSGALPVCCSAGSAVRLALAATTDVIGRFVDPTPAYLLPPRRRPMRVFMVTPFFMACAFSN